MTLANSSSLKPTQNQARNAFRVVVLVVVTTFILLATSLYSYTQGNTGLTDLIVIGIATGIQLFNLWLCRKGQSSLAIGILLATIWFVMVNNQFANSGTGLALGIFGVSITILVAAQTMPSRTASRVILIGIGMGVGVLLLDLFGAPRTPTHSLTSILVIGGVFLVANLVYVARQFSNYSLRTKLLVAGVALTALSVSLLAIVSDQSNRANLTANAGTGLKSIADSQAAAIRNLLNDKINTLAAFGLSKVVQDKVAEADANYGAADTAAIQKQIDDLDQEWRIADGANTNNTAIIQNVLNNDAASELVEFSETFPDNVEVFVTDKYGANVAATHRTSDYYQADEDWWQGAYHNGTGATYVGQPTYDLSSKTFGLIIALPLYAHGTQEVIGVLRSTLNINAVLDLLSVKSLNGTGHSDLFLPGGNVLAPENPNGLNAADPDTLAVLDNLTNNLVYTTLTYEGTPNLLSAVPLVAKADQNTPIGQLGWAVVIHQDQSASLAPVEAQTRNTILLSLVILALGSAGSVLTARVLATPILNLTKTAEQVAAGDLTVQAPITTGDEIGQLATTFNGMTAQLRQTVTGLEERVAERTRALALSAEISRRLSGLLDQQQLITEVVEQVRASFNYYHTHIYLLDTKGESLVMAGGTGEAARTMLARGHRIEAGRGLVGRAAKSNASVLVSDVSQDVGWLPNPLLPGTQSEVAVPIAIGGRVLGVLDVQHQNVNGLSEADVQVLQTIANQVGIALQNARSYEQARTQVERETFINALNQKIQRAASIPDVLEIAARELGQMLGARRAVAQVNNPTKNINTTVSSS